MIKQMLFQVFVRFVCSVAQGALMHPPGMDDTLMTLQGCPLYKCSGGKKTQKWDFKESLVFDSKQLGSESTELQLTSHSLPPHTCVSSHRAWRSCDT